MLRHPQVITRTAPLCPYTTLFRSAACKRCLTPGGVLVTQNGVPFMQADELRGTVALLKKHFADASCYLASVPTYAWGAMAFGWATDDTKLRRQPLATLQRSEEHTSELQSLMRISYAVICFKK